METSDRHRVRVASRHGAAATVTLATGRGLLVGLVLLAVLTSGCSRFQQGYPRNANGETYGSAVDARHPDDEPDLIEAIGDNGVVGYVKKSDVDEPSPRSPAEAIARQEARQGSKKVVPLYESDGETVIGRFTMRPDTVQSTERATEN